MKSAALLPLLAGLLPALAFAATVQEHPDFTEDRFRPTRWLLLPPEASITRGRVTDAEPMIKETEALETALAREAARSFGALGYRLDAESASAQALAADEELLAIADEARDRARETLARASTDPKGIARGRFTIGDAGLPLAAATGADGLLLLQSQSLIVSKGSKALSAIFNPLNLVAATRTRTQVVGALYDLRDGQLLAVVLGRDVGAVLKNPDEVARQVLDSAFRELPRQGVGQAAKRKFREAAPAREVEPVPELGGSSGEQVLAAFDEVAGELEAPVDRDAAAAGDAPAPPREAGGADDLNEAQAGPGPDTAPPAATTIEMDPREQEPRLAPRGAEAEAIEALLAAPPEERPEPELQVVFLGDAGETGVRVRNMAPRVVRVSLDRGAWRVLEAGGVVEFGVDPGGHRLLVADAAEDREIARAAVVASEGRLAIVELWPAPASRSGSAQPETPR
jgi:hypothetical protein